MDVVQIAIIIASAAIGFMIGALVFYARTENKIEDAIINAVEERERCIIERDQLLVSEAEKEREIAALRGRVEQR